MESLIIEETDRKSRLWT